MDQPWWGSRETLALTISEAARICGVGRRAIRRHHQAGEFAHAFKDAEGAWRIPVNDLIEVGLQPHLMGDPDEPRIVSAAASHVERLRTEVAVLRERVRALEVIAREREERVEDLRLILRMLPAPRETDQLPLPGLDEAPAPELDEASGRGVEEAPRVVEDEGPFKAPMPAGASSATAWQESVAGSAPPGGADRAVPPPPQSEPIVVLPDATGAGSVSAEAARQRPAELLEEAMSLWWPTPRASARQEAGSSSLPDAADEWREAASVARREDEQGEEAAPGLDARDEPVAGNGDQQEGGNLGDPFSSDSYDEASYDWMEPGIDRPPRHRRHRLGRFFRRNRRPR